jgi:hypothetical protein
MKLFSKITHLPRRLRRQRLVGASMGRCGARLCVSVCTGDWRGALDAGAWHRAGAPRGGMRRPACRTQRVTPVSGADRQPCARSRFRAPRTRPSRR